jgi:hypothetical protein
MITAAVNERKPGVAKEFVASGKHRKPLGFSGGFCFEETQPQLRKAWQAFLSSWLTGYPSLTRPLNSPESADAFGSGRSTRRRVPRAGSDSTFNTPPI